MTKQWFCLAINGLHEELFGRPLGQLASFLNHNLPSSVHFSIVGGVDPRPFQMSFEHSLAVAHGAGAELIVLGHSLGAMMCFYLADSMKKQGVPIKLLVPIDATDWGTNLALVPWMLGGAQAGHYQVQDNVDHCLYFRQPVYPGGGYAALAPGNKHTTLDAHNRIEPHVVLPITPAIQQMILSAALEAIK